MAATALGVALEKNGISPMVNDFDLAIAKFQNLGGSREVAIARIERAYGRNGNEEDGGRTLPAAEGGSERDCPTSSSDGVGQRNHAEEVIQATPTPSPPERSAGQPIFAGKAREVLPVAAPPRPPLRDRHKPGHAARGLGAIASIQPGIAKALFATYRLVDGRPASDVRWSEAPALAQRSAKDARILIAAHRYAIPPDHSMTLGECVPEAEQRNIISMVERINAI